jgi:hypothetical protein
MGVNGAKLWADLHSRGWSLVLNAGFTDGEMVDSAALRELCGLVGTPSSQDGDQVVWPVRPRSTAQDATFSMRSGSAALHTDAAYRIDPEPYVALFCVRPARDGGLSSVLSEADVAAGLSREHAADLRRPIWQWRPPAVFGGVVTDPRPVLQNGGRIRWRFDTLELTAETRTPAMLFHTYLADHSSTRRFMLPADSVLFLDNHRVLHGRSAFTDPQRLLLRVRLLHRLGETGR